jgi:hypothetical protein
MLKFQETLALLATLCMAAAGDVRVENVGADKGTERGASEVVSDVLVMPISRTPARASRTLESPRGAGTRGQFRLLTYNVAGLPELVSPSHPAVNCAQMSPQLNRYDLAFVQEDFSYHAALGARSRHPFRSETMQASLTLMPDGLSLFSRFTIGKTHRVRWTRCSGHLSAANDCLADKGFSLTEVTLGPGVTIDAYNLHADAGGGGADIEARRANFEQLGSFMRARPAARAVLVAGDTNLSPSRAEDGAVLEALLRSTQLVDVCDRVQCPDAGIDRVFFRGSTETELFVLAWWKDSRFVDAKGEGLSDHPAIGVEMAWHHSAEPRRLVATTDPH